MVNELFEFSQNILKEWCKEGISNWQQLPFMKKAVTWFGRVHNFWNSLVMIEQCWLNQNTNGRYYDGC